MKQIFFNIIKIKLSIIAKIFGRKNNSKKVSILAFKLLGDTVFTIPAIKKIVENLEGKKVTIFCFEESKPVYDLVLKNVEFITFNRDKINFNTRWLNFKLIQAVRKENAGYLFDLTCEYQTAAATLLSGTKETAGFNTKYFAGVYKVFTEKRSVPTLIEMHLDPVLKYFGLPAQNLNEIITSEFNKEGVIIIQPFAGWKAKEWDLNRFIRLAEELNSSYEVKFLVKKNLLTKEISGELIQKGISIEETNTIDELINELKSCSLIISNDTGPVYLAFLMGKATFTIYGPTNPEFSLPYGSIHGFIKEDIFCSPPNGKQYCYTYGGRLCTTYDCMKELSYNKVKEAVFALIDKLGISKKKVGVY